MNLFKTLTTKFLTRKWPGNIYWPLPGSDHGKVRSKAFVLTIWTEEKLKDLIDSNPDYLVYAPEECPTTKKKHWQCYVHYKNPRYLGAMWKKFPMQFCRPAEGSAEENRVYIMGPYEKGDKKKPINPDAVAIGTRPEQGKRNDLQLLMDDVKLGKRGRELTEAHPETIAKYPRFEERLILEDDKITAWEQYESGVPPEIHVRWGAPRIGKTRLVYEKHGRNVYRANLNKNSIWFDGYDGEDVIIIDEFNGQIEWEYFLQLIDRYPVQLPVKRSFRWRKATKFYITSNNHPERWYPAEEHREALLGRLTSITEVFPPCAAHAELGSASASAPASPALSSAGEAQ